MSEKIEPALPPKEWKRIRLHDMRYEYLQELNTKGFDVLIGATRRYQLEVDASHELVVAASEADDRVRRRAVIAILNDMLPEADPGKLTRDKIELVRDVLEDAGVTPALMMFIDGLEAYLPPA